MGQNQSAPGGGPPGAPGEQKKKEVGAGMASPGELLGAPGVSVGWDLSLLAGAAGLRQPLPRPTAATAAAAAAAPAQRTPRACSQHTNNHTHTHATQEKKKKWEPPAPPPRVGKKQRRRDAASGLGSKLPAVTPSAKCKLRLLKLERIKDYLLMEHEFVAGQELLKPQDERNEEDRSKVPGAAQRQRGAAGRACCVRAVHVVAVVCGRLLLQRHCVLIAGRTSAAAASAAAACCCSARLLLLLRPG